VGQNQEACAAHLIEEFHRPWRCPTGSDHSCFHHPIISKILKSRDIARHLSPSITAMSDYLP
jgi:hypothetical protein